MKRELVGVAEVAKLLGISRARVGQLAKTANFPEPVARLAAGPVWESADIQKWARQTGRQWSPSS
ncbi:MAG: AlpA family phage regulatory protein [Nocardioides sp.]